MGGWGRGWCERVELLGDGLPLWKLTKDKIFSVRSQNEPLDICECILAPLIWETLAPPRASSFSFLVWEAMLERDP